MTYISSYSQNQMQRQYEYDASGNRVLRHVLVLSTRMAQQNDSENDSSEVNSSTCYTEQIGALQLSIYPNPTLGQVSVTILNATGSVSGTLRIYTLSGQLLRTHTIETLSSTLDLSGYPAGTYLVKVQLNQNEQARKIIKE
jgi:hypothetical protein